MLNDSQGILDKGKSKTNLLDAEKEEEDVLEN